MSVPRTGGTKCVGNRIIRVLLILVLVRGTVAGFIESNGPCDEKRTLAIQRFRDRHRASVLVSTKDLIEKDSLRTSASTPQLVHVDYPKSDWERAVDFDLNRPAPPHPSHLIRMACRLRNMQPTRTLFIGSSNTDGRYRPYFTTVFHQHMNAVFAQATIVQIQAYTVYLRSGEAGKGIATFFTAEGVSLATPRMRRLLIDEDGVPCAATNRTI